MEFQGFRECRDHRYEQFYVMYNIESYKSLYVVNPVQQKIPNLTNIILNLSQGIPGLKGVKVRSTV